jgi:hypothetical protein
MKLLFDQNISFRVKDKLVDIFPEARHVKDFNLQFATDYQIREFARTNGYDVVTFDADFYDLATLFGTPPKIIWLRIGNTSTKNLVEILQNQSLSIRRFLEEEELRELVCLEVYS